MIFSHALLTLFQLRRRGIPSAACIADNILSIARKNQQGSSASRIYVQTILPASADIKANTQLVNGLIKSNGLPGIYTTADLHKAFTNSQGLMPQDLTTGGLHLNEKVYKVWTNFIDSLVRQISPKITCVHFVFAVPKLT